MTGSYGYRPVRFFLLTYIITWVTWFVAAYLSYQKGGGFDKAISSLEVAGLFGPFLVAMWMIFRSNNEELKQNFYKRLFDLKLIRLSSIPAIFLIVPATVVLSVVISHYIFGESLDQLLISKNAPFVAGVIPVPVMLFGAALIEELGWKGYGVDSLRGERTFFKATLIYALLWGFWHLPTFFVNNYYQNMLLRTNPLFALNFFVSIIPAAFIINWLWYKNRGSILTAVLLHAVINFQGILQMGQIAKCIQTVVWIIVAVIIVSLNRKTFFERFRPEIGYYI